MALSRFSSFLGARQPTEVSDCFENRGAGVSPAGARAFLRCAQDRLCPRTGAGRSRDCGRDARTTLMRCHSEPHACHSTIPQRHHGVDA
jgi:hypothetical protein